MLSKQVPVRAGVRSTGSLIAPDDYHVLKKTVEAMAVSLYICSGEIERCNVYEPQRNDWHERTERALLGPDQLSGILGLRDLRRCTTFQYRFTSAINWFKCRSMAFRASDELRVFRAEMIF